MTKRKIAQPNLQDLTFAEARDLVKRGYVPRGVLFDEEFADAFVHEIDRLIDKGTIPPSSDRFVGCMATEWIVTLGLVAGLSLDDAEIFKTSPLLAELFRTLQNFGESFNRLRVTMLEAGAIRENQILELGVEGMELNVNRVMGVPEAVWSGHHLHTDDARFNAALRAIDPTAIAHDAVRGRAFTISGYARRRGEDGAPMNDIGGALPFVVREGARNPGDQAVFDIVPAHHNTGAFFFPQTVHGVSRMVEGGVRYSFQAFYPSAAAWRKIKRRMAASRSKADSESLTKK